MSFSSSLCLATATALVAQAAAFAPAGPNFVPDYTFKGSELPSWQTLGAADWKAQDGKITGTPREASGGWLVLDKSFSQVGFYADMHCTDGCKAGVLFRMEKSPGGSKGIFVSLTEGDQGSYAVQLNAKGQVVSRKKLPVAEDHEAFGNGPKPVINADGTITIGNRKIRIGVLPLPPGINLPQLSRPEGAYKPGGWNSLEVLVTDDGVRPALNGGTLSIFPHKPEMSGAISDSMGSYGPIALYVGGTSPVELKNLSYKDLLIKTFPREYVADDFKMQRLNEFYYSWSAAIADVNRDGVPDVIAGPYVYLGPDYTTARELYTPVAYNPTADYPQGSMVNLAYDFTGDGWPDVLVMSGSAGSGIGTLYVNPKGESRLWEKHVVLPKVGNEDTLLKDIDGDGKPEIIHAGDDRLRYSKPDPANPSGTWITTTISEPGPWGANIGHGLGVGDVNGDGRMDFLSAYGWWEQPPKGSSQELWTYHPQAFGRWGHSQGGAGGAEIGVYDVNGDGLNDVVTALEGHAFGLAWYEQKKDASGKISFEEHMIMDKYLTKNAGDVFFTEPHATFFADMNGDGIPDLVTGKRSMSHLFGYSDPDPFGAAVLYVYKTVRNPQAPGGAEFVPELIHNRSGVGSRIAVADLNGDGKPDIATSGVAGTFVFFNNTKPADATTKTAGIR